MTSAHHSMTIEAENAEELLFACDVEVCGRRVVMKRSGGYVVLNKGDFFATHSGGRGLTLEVGAPRPGLGTRDAN
jgi:hypothetical protein